jgi:hypothetical protein
MISSVDVRSGDVELKIEKDLSGSWLVNGALVDSTKATQYIRGLANLSFREFADASNISTKNPLGQVNLITGNSENINLNIFPKDQNGKYVLTTSSGEGPFYCDSTSVFSKIIVGPSFFNG